MFELLTNDNTAPTSTVTITCVLCLQMHNSDVYEDVSKVQVSGQPHEPVSGEVTGELGHSQQVDVELAAGMNSL
jgi:hypothetical protein